MPVEYFKAEDGRLIIRTTDTTDDGFTKTELLMRKNTIQVQIDTLRSQIDEIDFNLAKCDELGITS